MNKLLFSLLLLCETLLKFQLHQEFYFNHIFACDLLCPGYLRTSERQRAGICEVKRTKNRLEALVRSLVDVGMIPEVPLP